LGELRESGVVSAPIADKLALGGITEPHLACHPDGGALDVGFWATGRNARQWWFVDDAVEVTRRKLLTAAVVPPTESL